MAIKLVQKFKDAETDQELELIECPCGNNVYYITTENEKICACCHMTQAEAEAKKNEAG